MIGTKNGFFASQIYLQQRKSGECQTCWVSMFEYIEWSGSLVAGFELINCSNIDGELSGKELDN